MAVGLGDVLFMLFFVASNLFFYPSIHARSMPFWWWLLLLIMSVMMVIIIACLNENKNPQIIVSKEKCIKHMCIIHKIWRSIDFSPVGCKVWNIINAFLFCLPWYIFLGRFFASFRLGWSCCQQKRMMFENLSVFWRTGDNHIEETFSGILPDPWRGFWEINHSISDSLVTELFWGAVQQNEIRKTFSGIMLDRLFAVTRPIKYREVNIIIISIE